MPNPWFRLYSEFEDDPKVQRMSEAMQRRFVMLLCSHCKEEKRTDEDFAFKWHVTSQDVTETKKLFLEKGLIDEDWNLLNWNRRQFISDSSAERTRQWRERLRQSGTSQNVTVTKRDGTDTDTDTEKKQIKKHKKQVAPLPEWIPLEAWNGFMEMRSKSKTPLTERAVKKTLEDLDKFRKQGLDLEAILDQSTMRCYRGVFPVKSTNGFHFQEPQTRKIRNIGE